MSKKKKKVIKLLELKILKPVSVGYCVRSVGCSAPSENSVKLQNFV